MNGQNGFEKRRKAWKVSGHRARPGRRAVPGAFGEPLEPRQVPAVLVFPAGVVPVSAAAPSETVDRAVSLGDLGAGQDVGATGTIGGGPAGAADVAWYHFTLGSPATVTLTAGAGAEGDAFHGVVSLYNEDPLDFGDPTDPLGRRLLAQDEAARPGDLARVVATLSPGSYDVAVSGAGNRDFHPLMAGSGYDGSTGDYNLLASSRPLGLAPGSGPAVIASDPAAGAAPDTSPPAVRLALSGALDPATVAAGSTVRLVYSPTGSFGDGNDADVALASVNFSAAADELQLFPQSALKPGFYRAVLAGDSGPGSAVLAAPDGTPLGADAGHPGGQDQTVSFRVTGVEGGASAADTLAAAHDLGDVTAAGRVRVAGALGADPYYDSASPDPGRNPGNEVDFYRFHVTGDGPFALVAEVFAGRIGSPLDAGVALYRVDPATGALQFVGGNNNSGNQAAATDGSNPLLVDPALFSTLTAGDYVLAVSSGSNTPSPLEGTAVGSPGLYDPAASHSGQSGFGTGAYVLNFQVAAAPEPPRVVATGPAAGAVLAAPPTALSVQFTEPVNLQQAGFQAYQQNSQSAIASAYVVAGDGTKVFPRLQSFDPATNTATFLMLDALPNGSYALHLSGAGGLTDLAGNPLVGNDPGGDYVVHFTVDGAARGGPAGPRNWSAVAPAGGDAQDLGVLFPRELQNGVDVNRDPAADRADTGDAFRFQVLQSQVYTFVIQGSGGLTSDSLTLTDDQGRPVSTGPVGNAGVSADLAPGVYVVHVGSWAADQAGSVSYRLTMKLVGNADNPVPLVSGPAPALQLRLSALPGPGGSGGTSSPTPSDPGGTSSPTPSVPGGTSSAPSTNPGGSAPVASTGSSSGGSSGSGGSVPSAPTGPGGAPSGGGSSSYAYGPAASGGGSGSSAAGSGSSSGGSTSLAASSGATSSGGLIALSVAPVGSLHGNAEAAGAAGSSSSAAQVAFSLPSQPSTVPSMARALAGLMTTTRVIEADAPTGPGEEHAGTEGDSPALVFDEVLKRVSESSPVAPAPAPAEAVAATDAPSAAEPPRVEAAEALASAGDAPPGVGTTPLPGGDEAAPADTAAEVRLSSLVWGTAVAAAVSVPLAMIKRQLRARFGLAAATGRDPAEPAQGLAGPTRHRRLSRRRSGSARQEACS